MNYLNFNQSVGFPLETDILHEMQKAYTLFNALGAVVGNFSIISGCVVNGTSITDGVLFIDGEIIEFKGGVVQDNIIIVENKTSLEFEDTNSHDVIFTRYATFGTATVQWAWSTFKRGFPTIDIQAALDLKATTASVSSLASAINTIVTKLNTIDDNAKIQVQTDWNATSGKGVLLNKPSIEESGILMTGTVAANGNKTNYYKKDFTAALEGDRYKITHNLGTLDYAVVGAGTTDGTLKIGMYSKTENICVLGVSDDSSLNVGDFSFMIFKIK